MKTGTKLHGFEVARVREFEELGGRLVEMTHEKTGARSAGWTGRRRTRPFALPSKRSRRIPPAFSTFWSTLFCAVPTNTR